MSRPGVARYNHRTSCFGHLPPDVPHLLAHLAEWKPFTALVVGDFMLDQHVFGDAERLTADAPVPILHVRRTEQNPGGAANVAMDLVALHGRVHAFGVIGADPEGRMLADELDKGGITTDGLVTDASRPTTVKRSLIGLAQHRHPQKMFRVDYESREPIADRVIDEMIRRFEAALPQADAVAIEDYGKGVCTPGLCAAIIDRCRRAGKEVLIDPACISDYSKYRSATCITPNRTEAEVATGLETHESNDAAHNGRLAHALLHALQLDAVVLTLDRHGALLLEQGGAPTAIPTVARQVYDVTGAGDMVLAALLAARANRIAWEDAVRFANAAAGLEVEIFGCKPIPFERVRREAARVIRGIQPKVFTRDELAAEVSIRRAQGERIVFTNGCFDVLHPGHVALLEEAKRHGSFLVVAINTDETVRRYKGPTRPVHNEAERSAVLCGLQAVDAVVSFAEDTPVALIELLRPEALVKGDEYPIEKIPGAGFVASYGGKIVRVPMLDGHSTTEALRRAGHPAAVVTTDRAARERFIADHTQRP